MNNQAGKHTTIGNYPCQSNLSVRYGDYDADGLISDTAIARYVEQARSLLMIEALREAGIDLHSGPIGMLIASVKLDMIGHRAPGREVRLATGVSRTGRSSIDLRVGIFSNDACIAVAENVMVIISRDSGRPVPMPTSLLERLEYYACK